MTFVSPKLRQSARGEECTFQTPYCVGGTETTVLCHGPSPRKGMGGKAPDYWAAFGCSGCHDALDTHRMTGVEEQFYWLKGIHRTLDRWVARGLIVVTGLDPETVKTRPKKPGNWPKDRKLQSANNLRKQA